MTTLAAFERAHKENNQRLHRYAYTRWAAETYPPRVHEDIYDRSAMSLRATNAKSRIAFVKAALPILTEAAAVSSAQPAFHLTIIPPAGLLLRADAYRFDWSMMEAWVADLLAGFEFFAMTDIAPYANTFPGWPAKPVSWHVHALVWGCSEGQMYRLVEHINTICPPLLPGLRPAVSRPIKSAKGLKQKIIYVCKAPLKTYKVYPLKGTDTGVWKQRKAFHKTGGEAALIGRLLFRVSITQLAFDSSNGKVVEEIANRARRKLRTKVPAGVALVA